MRETAHADDQLTLRGLEHPIVNGSLKWILQAMFRQRKPDSIHTTLDLHSADQSGRTNYLPLEGRSGSAFMATRSQVQLNYRTRPATPPLPLLADQMLDDSVWVISTFIKNDALVLERKSQREECP